MAGHDLARTDISIPATAADRLAFLAVVPGGETGYAAGLLVVNGIGRPLEFHCTAPFQPTETQRILFGATLERFIYCEQLGGPLINQLKSSPVAFIVQQSILLELASTSAAPWLWLVESPEQCSVPPSAGPSSLRELPQIDPRVRYCGAAAPSAELVGLCQRFAARLPWEEPFERVRQALDLALHQAR